MIGLVLGRGRKHTVELDDRDLLVILGALNAQFRYHLRLAERNKDSEAKIRNVRNHREVGALVARLEAVAERPAGSDTGRVSQPTKETP